MTVTPEVLQKFMIKRSKVKITASHNVCKNSQKKTRNVAIANALKLEAARATSALSNFNYDALPSLKSLNLSMAV